MQNAIFKCFLPQKYRLCINANTASSDVFFNTWLNQKAKYMLRLELDVGRRWLRVPKLILRSCACMEVVGLAGPPGFSRAGSEQAVKAQAEDFFSLPFSFPSLFFSPSLPVTWPIYSLHPLDI